jgi:hypothetical protein
MKEHKSLTGTARYASLNAHLGFEQSRRDDIEGLGMVFVYLLKGLLPWQGLNGDTKEERFQRIIDKKKQITPNQLCAGLPSAFLEYFTYTRKLGFEEKPDYFYLRKLFQNVFNESGYLATEGIDWKSSNEVFFDSIPMITVNGVSDVFVTEVKKVEAQKEETSKCPHINSKSRNDISANEDNTECTQKFSKIVERARNLIHVPYTEEIFKCKAVLDKKKFVSSGLLLNYRQDDIPEEKDDLVITHFPSVSDYVKHKPVGCQTLIEGIKSLMKGSQP